MNLLSITRDKKVANISLMHAPMDEDVPLAFALGYVPSQLVNRGSPEGINEPIHVAKQHIVYGLCCSILEP
ncbi:hypothetical protein Golax_021725 [Gossypium laxum]|uniref:Uncharacterized protein n=1 Tax=Gossypium laxum TaxID=34288 RepID=A0A7J9AM15_9ROSI|nr:hypothetical protein [Gossypium laxum]